MTMKKHKIVFLNKPLIMHLDEKGFLHSCSLDFIGIFKLAGYYYGIGSDDQFKEFQSLSESSKISKLSNDKGLIRFLNIYKIKRANGWSKVPKIKFDLLYDEKILTKVNSIKDYIKRDINKWTRYYLEELKTRRGVC